MRLAMQRELGRMAVFMAPAIIWGCGGDDPNAPADSLADQGWGETILGASPTWCRANPSGYDTLPTSPAGMFPGSDGASKSG